MDAILMNELLEGEIPPTKPILAGSASPHPVVPHGRSPLTVHTAAADDVPADTAPDLRLVTPDSFNTEPTVQATDSDDSPTGGESGREKIGGLQAWAESETVAESQSVQTRSIDPPAGMDNSFAPMLPDGPSEQACDVDAFLDGRDAAFEDDPDDDDDGEGSYPRFPSSTTESTGYTAEDLEAHGNALPRAAAMAAARRRDPQFDPRTDPFAPRVGKTLAWRNVNMTLVRSIQTVAVGIDGD